MRKRSHRYKVGRLPVINEAITLVAMVSLFKNVHTMILTDYLLFVFLVMFYGLCPDKSSFFTTIWGIFDIFPSIWSKSKSVVKPSNKKTHQRIDSKTVFIYFLPPPSSVNVSGKRWIESNMWKKDWAFFGYMWTQIDKKWHFFRLFFRSVVFNLIPPP